MDIIHPEIDQEISWAKEAFAIGNDGKARVCARRAVNAALRLWGERNNIAVPLAANAVLDFIGLIQGCPPAIADAALRLKGGLRSQLEGGLYSSDPIGDALLISRYLS